MQSDLTVGYQDDITLGDPVQTVAQDVHRIAEQGSRMGLVLNASKCELIADSKMVVADPCWPQSVGLRSRSPVY